MAPLDVRVERLNHIIQQLSADVMATHTGALPAREVIGRVKDLKGPEPGDTNDNLLSFKSGAW